MRTTRSTRDWELLLDRLRHVADTPADDAVAAIVGDWQVLAPDADAQALRDAHGEQWKKLAQATALLNTLGANGTLATWPGQPPEVEDDVFRAVQGFVHAQQALPGWADTAKLQRAETLFYEYGPLSCILLFCASLPECYVLPDLATVLHRAGQLEQHTEYRIRSTAAMIFPVMMRGGLSDASGAGLGQILKVRLIHATIRNLILHGHPRTVFAGPGATAPRVVPAHPALAAEPGMHAAMFAGGWDAGHSGVPCNQEELAYTLLTFSYVFLRGLRRLGLGLDAADEEAYLHCWNVAASVLGVDDALMAHTMDEAQTLFDCMQARARGPAPVPDPRPALGRALVNAMEQTIPIGWLKPFAPLMTRYLCGRRTADLVGIDQHVSGFSRVLFELVISTTRLIDTLARNIWPHFSLSRLLTRVLGYRLVTRLLMDQTRSLRLPTQLLGQADAMLDHWGEDVHAPRWVNAIEDRLTTFGNWRD